MRLHFFNSAVIAKSKMDYWSQQVFGRQHRRMLNKPMYRQHKMEGEAVFADDITQRRNVYQI